MRLDSARSLKLEIAHEVFAPIVEGLLGHALAPRIGPLNLISPLLRIALGVGRGNGPGDFHLAVRLQSRSSETQRFVDRVRERVKDELHVDFIGRVTAFADEPATSKKTAALRETNRLFTVAFLRNQIFSQRINRSP